MTTKDIYEFLTIQNKVNITTQGDNWFRKENYKSPMAIIDEWGEFSQSIGYEWWKVSKSDLDNAILELADIIAFYLTNLGTRFPTFLHFYKDSDFSIVDSKYDFNTVTDKNLYYIIQSLVKDSLKEEPTYCDLFRFIKDLDNLSILMVSLLDKTNKKYLLPSNIYVGKSALNIFRQMNGYGKGEYNKIWEDDKEDNYYLMEYLSTTDNSITFESVMKFLELKYPKK